MDAAEKTDTLKRQQLSIDLLDPNEANPNKMSPREFNLLVDNIESVGFTDPVLVCKKDEGRYRIVGGHHRVEAARYLGMKEVPCTVITDPDFTQELQDFQLLRHNVIHGHIDPESFFALYQKYAGTYGDDLLQEMFGFAEEAEFKKLIQQTAKQLPDDLKETFLEAAKEVKTIDGLARLLNEMFTRHGDSLPYGYMVVDYGGQNSFWLRLPTKAAYDTCLDVGKICRAEKRTMDDIFVGVMKMIAGGELNEVVAKLVAESPEVDVGEWDFLPTKDNIEAAQM